MKLLGKIALVTGSARGIGRGCALELARAGADVVVNDLRVGGEVEGLAAEIAGLGRRSAVVEGDVFARAGCEGVVERAVAAFGRVDILVSNPAHNVRAGFLDYAPDDFERVINATLTSGFHMSQLVARHLVARKSPGKIVFISSVHDLVPYAQSVAYNAGKAG